MSKILKLLKFEWIQDTLKHLLPSVLRQLRIFRAVHKSNNAAASKYWCAHNFMTFLQVSILNLFSLVLTLLEMRKWERNIISKMKIKVWNSTCFIKDFNWVIALNTMLVWCLKLIFDSCINYLLILIISRFYSLSIVAVLLLRTEFSNPIHYCWPGMLQHEAMTRFKPGSAGSEAIALSSVLSHPILLLTQVWIGDYRLVRYLLVQVNFSKQIFTNLKVGSSFCLLK